MLATRVVRMSDTASKRACGTTVRVLGRVVRSDASGGRRREMAGHFITDLDDGGARRFEFLCYYNIIGGLLRKFDLRKMPLCLFVRDLL